MPSRQRTRQYLQAKDSAKSVSIQPKNPFAPRPFAPQPQTQPIAAPKQTYAEIMAKLERAERTGHSLSKMTIDSSQVPPSPVTQPKLTIGAPRDKYEQEADRVAHQVVSRLHSPLPQQTTGGNALQRADLPEEEDELMMKPEIGSIQRADLPEEDDELMMKPILQRQLGLEEVAATPDLEGAIASERGRGQSLADNLRQPMEQAFGADFSGVRIHADAQADRLNRSIQARAFTTGQDVFFRQGAYRPGSRGGQELIAHELTHVVQQNGNTVQRSARQRENLQQKVVDKTPSKLGRERLLQAKIEKSAKEPVSSFERGPNKTGLPDRLKCGVENLSGYSMDDVKVHYNSAKPSKIQAEAYTQGSNIYLKPNQEALLPHEAWHVVQQKQGRVTPTHMNDTSALNADPILERESDLMGAKAAQLMSTHVGKQISNRSAKPIQKSPNNRMSRLMNSEPCIQAGKWKHNGNKWIQIGDGPWGDKPKRGPTYNGEIYDDGVGNQQVAQNTFTEQWANDHNYAYDNQLSKQVVSKYNKKLGNAGGAHKPKGRVLVHSGGLYAISVDQDEHAGPAWKAHMKKSNEWAYAGTYDANLDKIQRGGAKGLGPSKLPK